MAQAEPPPRVLIVDDSPDTLEVLQRNLTAQGWEVTTAPGVKQAVKALEAKPVDVVVTDFKMPGISGLELVRHVRENCRDTVVLMITGYPSVQGAVQAVKTGAEDFLAKPFTDEELSRAVRGALDKLQARRALEDRATAPLRPGLVGECEPMRRVRRAVARAAALGTPVLLLGETGTGKQLTARTIHYSGPRAKEPFVPVQLAAIPAEQALTEVFGRDGKGGLFAAALAGTLYLDELNLAPPALQQALAQSLDGPARPRFVASASAALAGLVKRGAFREDLYYPLAVTSIELPPLRERGDDVLSLANLFARDAVGRAGRPLPHFSDEAIRVLRSYSWPGNVRELQSVVERLVLMASHAEVDVADLPALMRFSVLRDHSPLRTLADVETEYIEQVLAAAGGNQSRAAEILGIDRKTLREKRRRAAVPAGPEDD
jgi:two-component system, NtrC family, response regulator HydG